LFENFSPNIELAIEDDVKKIIDADPRWNLLRIDIKLGENSIEVELTLRYVPTATQEELYLMFTQEE
jgi:hypothetical protein